MKAQKWYTGEKWATFCAGERGSPGGPAAIAAIANIIVEDLVTRGVDSGSGDSRTPSAEIVATAPKAPKPRRGRRSLADEAADDAAEGLAAEAAGGDDDDEPPELLPAGPLLCEIPMATARPCGLEHVPTELEKECDPEDLAAIRRLLGSRAQVIINMLLAFDGYFAWYYPYKKSIPFMAPMPVRESRALGNCRSAIDMAEIYNRVAIHNHGSYLPHGAIYKCTRDILHIGDVWALDTSPLELQNANTKRVAETSGSRRMQMTSSGKRRVPSAESITCILSLLLPPSRTHRPSLTLHHTPPRSHNPHTTFTSPSIHPPSTLRR